MKTLRLILGDQLNSSHSWFQRIEDDIMYVLMEVRTETDYVVHHIQKVVGFFAAMRSFAQQLSNDGHHVIYIKLDDKHNNQSFSGNLLSLIELYGITHFEYQLPDEYRLNTVLDDFAKCLSITFRVYDSEHFYTTRHELGHFFEGKKSYLMESFYRYMRRKHAILMDGNEPVYGKWNFDGENRVKLPKQHKAIMPLVFSHDVTAIAEMIERASIKTIGGIDKQSFIWPDSRKESLELLGFFIENCLPLFGTYQDVMTPHEWSLYHSRLSFSLNTKMLSPQEVVETAITSWKQNPELITYNQLEGFVRQIIGWREYMRGIYWLKMPEFSQLNYFNQQHKLPDWYWTGNTKMNCLRHSIHQSLTYAYAHHIQRLMVTGNFALLAGVHPDEVDAWYLGIYIDAIDWVEITNTRGMSQFADGGIVGSKPYVSSAAYIDKMSHYCGTCYYNKNIKTGFKACPFNSLYWNFYHQHEALLRKNPRIGMAYITWDKMKNDDKEAILNQADNYLKHINEL